MSSLDIKCEIAHLIELLNSKGGRAKKREIVLNIDALEELHYNLTGERLGVSLNLVKEYPINASYAQSLAIEVNRTANALRGLTKKLLIHINQLIGHIIFLGNIITIILLI